MKVKVITKNILRVSKKQKKHRKHKITSRITSKSSDSVKKIYKDIPMHIYGLVLLVETLPLIKLEFNLFVAGELEIISSP